MSTTANTNTVSDAVVRHALSRTEVVQRLAANSEKGLSLSEVRQGSSNAGPRWDVAQCYRFRNR
jgi:hypothetical protein